MCIDYLPTSAVKGQIKGQKGKTISLILRLLDGVITRGAKLWPSYSVVKILHKALNVSENCFIDVAEAWIRGRE